MKFLTDEEIQEKLNSPENLKKRMEIHILEKRGRDAGQENMPEEIQKVISVLANSGETTQAEIAEAFGSSLSTVTRKKNGDNANGKPVPYLQGVIEKTNERIKVNKLTVEDKAVAALLSSFTHLIPKLPDIRKAKELSSVMRDIAAVAKDMSSRQEDDRTSNVHLHIYAPERKSVEDYSIIDI